MDFEYMQIDSTFLPTLTSPLTIFLREVVGATALQLVDYPAEVSLGQNTTLFLFLESREQTDSFDENRMNKMTVLMGNE